MKFEKVAMEFKCRHNGYDYKIIWNKKYGWYVYRWELRYNTYPAARQVFVDGEWVNGLIHDTQCFNTRIEIENIIKGS